MFLTTFELVLFDVDGTLVRPKSGKEFRETPADWDFLPGRVEAIKGLIQSGPAVAIVTNQGGAAYGYFKVSEMSHQLALTAQRLGIGEARRGRYRNNGIYVCFTHPDGTVEGMTEDAGNSVFHKLPNRRKPGPGMIQEAMRDYGATPEFTLMVGDRPEDKGAAEAAGCQFMWADEFFSPPP